MSSCHLIYCPIVLFGSLNLVLWGGDERLGRSLAILPNQWLKVASGLIPRIMAHGSDQL